jgi:hypothetical protein
VFGALIFILPFSHFSPKKLKKKKKEEKKKGFSFFSPSPIHSRRTKGKKKNGKREGMKREEIRAFKVMKKKKTLSTMKVNKV